MHYPVPGLYLCDLLYSAWRSLAFPWSSLQSTDYTYYVCDVTKELVHMEYLAATLPVFLTKTPAGTIALFDASTSSCTINRRHIDNVSPSHQHHHQNYPITSTSHIWPSDPAPPRSSDKIPLSQFTPPFVIYAQKWWSCLIPGFYSYT